jgi:hypothetical protein
MCGLDEHLIGHALRVRSVNGHAETTGAEGAAIVAGVQRGLASRGYDRGPIMVDETHSPDSEHAIAHFHKALVRGALTD